MRIASPSVKSRPENAVTARALISESFPLGVTSAAQNMVSGTAYLSLLGLRAGDVVTNVVVILNGVGTTVTLFKLGLYDTTGARLAVSADQSGALSSAAPMVVAMGTPYVIPADGGYYAAVLAVWSGATPTIPGLASFGARSRQIGTGARVSADVAGLADLTTPLTLANGSISLWLGVS